MPNDSPDWTTNTARPQTVSSQSPVNYLATTTVVNVPVTPDTHVIGLCLPGSATITDLEVTGHDTGALYLSLRPLLNPPGPVQWIPIMSAVDTSIDVSITASLAGTAYIVLMGESSGVIAYPANGSMAVRITSEPFAFTVDQVAATSNPWIHPRQYKYIDTGALEFGASFTAITGVAGKTIYMFNMVLQPIDSGVFVQVWDGTVAAGTHFDIFVTGATGVPANQFTPTVPPHRYGGVPLTAGNGLVIENTSTGTHDWVGYVTYTQI